MPSWVKDEKKWKEAKAIAERQYDIGEDNPDFYKVVTGIYKKMGGEMRRSIVFMKAHIRRHNRKMRSGKVVVVREHNDKRIKQLSFDFAGMYSGLDVRPQTTATQKKLGIAACKDIEKHIIGSRAKNRHGISLLASDLCKDFVEHGKTNLVGQVVKSPKDLASLAQVYRDPRFETFRVFYTSKDKIVGECAYSCRAPGIVAFDGDFFDLIGKDKDRFEADGYWILHNHPSGNAEPSKADIRITSRIRELVSGFKGHVVIDHNEYALIDSSDNAQVFKSDDLGGVDFGKNPAVGHDLLGMAISDPKHVAFAAKILQSLNQLDNPVLVITKGSRGEVSLIASVPPGAIPDSKDSKNANAKASAWLRSVGRKTGAGGHFFLIVSDKMLDDGKKKYVDLIRSGIVLDVVTESGRSLQEAGAFSSGHESVWDERLLKPAKRKIVGTLKKSHPIKQAVLSKHDDLVDDDVRRNPGEPSPAKAKADDYAKPVKKWNGLSIRIENPAGSVRRGKTKCGHSWETRMVCDYGYIDRTEGVDGDEIDVYLGPNESAPMVYVVHQRKHGDWDVYDEDKCMLGFDSKESAVAAYLQHYDDDRFLGPVTALPFAKFKEKVMQTQDNPAMIKGMIIILKSMVAPHTRRLKSGKVVQVKGYTDKRTKKVETSEQQGDLFGNDVHVMPKKEAVDEHKRLVGVLNSPSHADDKKEAKRQAKELKEMQSGTGDIDLKGFKKVDNGDGKFSLHDGSLVVNVVPTEKGKFQASIHAGPTSSPHMAGEQVVIDWADNYRTAYKKMVAERTPKKAKVVKHEHLNKRPAAGDKAGPTADEAADPRRKYYVTMMRDGKDRPAYLAGPFDRHEDALGHVEAARKKAQEVDPRAVWDSFGTAGVVADKHHPGVLNTHLGIGNADDEAVKQKMAEAEKKNAEIGSLKPNQKVPANSVVLQARGRDGEILGQFHLPHDGTEEGMARASSRLRAEVGQYHIGPDMSNVNSHTGATGHDGKMTHIIAPNGKIAPAESNAARYALGDLSAAPKDVTPRRTMSKALRIKSVRLIK